MDTSNSSSTSEGSYLIPVSGEILSGNKKKYILILLGLVILLAISVYIIDWVIFFNHLTGITITAVLKASISGLSFVIAALIGKNYLDKRDRNLLLLAFCCMFPTDIITSYIGVSTNVDVSGSLFMVAGVLSILAHFILAFRHGRKFPYLRKSIGLGGTLSAETTFTGKLKVFWHKTWIFWIIFIIAGISIIFLWSDMVRINHQVIGPVYTLFFCLNTWFAWETVRYKLYPKKNAIFAALAMTGWYLTEIIGEVSNIGIGTISQIAFNLVWVVYGANVILVALSGYRWK